MLSDVGFSRISEGHRQFLPDYVNIPDKDGETVLHIASMGGFLKIAQILLQHDANPNIQKKRDRATPLHLATSKRNTELAKILLESNAITQMGGNIIKVVYRIPSNTKRYSI